MTATAATESFRTLRMIPAKDQRMDTIQSLGSQTILH